jgi:phosphoribosylformylglycinamidine synthase
MDLKEPGNVLMLLGTTRDEMAGSHFDLVTRPRAETPAGDGAVPTVDTELAPRIFAKLHNAICQGLVRSCHDLSEGGLAVALAEMAFAGEIGADVTKLPGDLPDEVALFSESATRFLIEVPPTQADAVETIFTGLPLMRIGATTTEPRLRIAGANGEWVVWASLSDLKQAWQKPLAW